MVGFLLRKNSAMSFAELLTFCGRSPTLGRVTTYRILAADGVSPKGIAILAESPHFEVETSGGLKEDETDCPPSANWIALIVRSQTKVTAKALAAGEAAEGHRPAAGVGVDKRQRRGGGRSAASWWMKHAGRQTRSRPPSTPSR